MKQWPWVSHHMEDVWKSGYERLDPDHFRMPDYQPIEDHGVIGNLRTVALIAKTGLIDWFCFPRFDSPSVFGCLLDASQGGHFLITPCQGDVIHKQIYLPDTNVLITRFLGDDGVGEINDYMPLETVAGASEKDADYCLIRTVKSVRGSMRFRLECRPAFNYARDPHEVQCLEGGVAFRSPALHLALGSDVPLRADGPAAVAEFELREGQSSTFVLHAIGAGENALKIQPAQCERLFHQTIQYWRQWITRSTYRGRWREIVNRSALALKLLTYAPTGAIVAAPTCGLPERLGGIRNWDYRYTWLRDAAFVIYSLLRIGFTEEAVAFVQFLDARCHEMGEEGTLQPVYGIGGEHDLTERVLNHLEGYRGSAPVRIGNEAFRQTQLDMYGELMDALYLYNKYVTPVSYDLWSYVRHITNWVARNWQTPDAGIWEVRGGPQQFVYSKLMCWVALDRAIRLASKRSFPGPRDEWARTRDEIYEAIMHRGWNPSKQAFVQRFGSDALDAAALLMPLVFFVSPTDPRMLKTLDAILQRPRDGGLVSDGLVYRYDVARTPDGLRGTEGTFSLCTFWLVEAMARASQQYPERLHPARLLFEKMLGYANHLGLFSEQISHRGEALGNFPQALTHLALISAAYNLDQYIDASRNGSIRPSEQD